MASTILVTGGAGYIGSHMVRHLCDAGETVVVVDDLSSGHAKAVDARASFYVCAVNDAPRMKQLLGDHGVTDVVHFAARIRVEESVKDPARYYEGNLRTSLAFLESCIDAKVARFVFSSTAAVYGAPLVSPIPEDHVLSPLNPYGFTKFAFERALADFGAAYGLHSVALRYFNAAGANVEAGLRECHDPETHLIPLALEAARGTRSGFSIFGTDYDTKDGTCVRDYVHVMDLARAHECALRWMKTSQEPTNRFAAFNVGSGEGASVREVLACIERVTGHTVAATESPRRPGDPAVLVADISRAKRDLGWSPSRSSLETIIEDAWRAK